MGAQHTLGPWVSVRRGERQDVSGVVAESNEANNTFFIATTHGPDQEGNANLIAAAPDGLAANKAFVETVESGAGVQDGMTLDQAYTEVLKQYGHGIAKAYDAAYAAIEKAEGR